MSERISWKISIANSNNVWNDHHNIHITSGDIVKLAMDLSKVYPGEDVTIEAFARIRMRIRDGVIVQERDDITEFYNNMTSQAAHGWKQIQEFACRQDNYTTD